RQRDEAISAAPACASKTRLLRFRLRAKRFGGLKPVRSSRSERRRVARNDINTSMKIRLAENFRAVFYAPFYATQALGFHAREGLDVEFVESSAPGEAVAHLLDGTVDVIWGGPMRVMKARDQDPESPLVCFGEVVARDPFFLVGRPGIENFS